MWAKTGLRRSCTSWYSDPLTLGSTPDITHHQTTPDITLHQTTPEIGFETFFFLGGGANPPFITWWLCGATRARPHIHTRRADLTVCTHTAQYSRSTCRMRLIWNSFALRPETLTNNSFQKKPLQVTPAPRWRLRPHTRLCLILPFSKVWFVHTGFPDSGIIFSWRACTRLHPRCVLC